MKLFQDNTSIECLSAEIISRRIVSSSYMLINNIGKCLVYKCSKNSEAVIKKELSPKEAVHNQNSSLDLDDMLEGENITVAMQARRGPKISKVGAHSHRHNAQTCKSDKYTFAMITKQIPGNPFAIPPHEIIAVEPKKIDSQI